MRLFQRFFISFFIALYIFSNGVSVLAEDLIPVPSSDDSVVESSPEEQAVIEPLETETLSPDSSTSSRPVSEDVFVSSTPDLLPDVVTPLMVSSTSDGFNEDMNQVFEDIVDKSLLQVPSSSVPLSIPSYTLLMRSLKDVQSSTTLKSSDKQKIVRNTKEFIRVQKEKLDTLDVDKDKQKKYIKRLSKQIEAFDEDPSAWQETKQFFSDLFRPDEEANTDEDAKNEQAFILPKNPARFQFGEKNIPVKKLGDTKIRPVSGQNITKSLKDMVKIEAAGAVMADPSLPVIEDTRSDDGEVIITDQMRELVQSLENNPLKIVNFLRENIVYEPYFGAKKGSVGCLQDLVCNDVDSASLSIALFRAAGIPAHYKKSIAVMSVEQLKNMLGVDETKTVYAALALNKVPVFVISGNNIDPNFDNADFSHETYLAVQWMYTEAFYEYDERGANFSNGFDVGTVTTTEELRDILRTEYAKQWIPVDVVAKPYLRTKRPILADQARFNSQTFWDNYLLTENVSSSVAVYKADLERSTGQSLENNLSNKTIASKTLGTLPISLPYFLGTGNAGGGNIEAEQFSSLPENFRYQIRMSVLREDNNDVVLEHNFFGTEIQNHEISLTYTGATAEDNAVIESFGGIHATPAELVDLKALFVLDGREYESNGENISIGDSLILRFELVLDDEVLYRDEKFSVAGNQEGIYLTLSKIQENPLLDTPSKILIQGNASIAWAYLKRMQEEGSLLGQSLDYGYNIHFARAVVTQNRVLSPVDGTATTFDFKGLTIDSAIYIMDYSSRGDYKTHQRDFRLLYGLNESFYEGQVFTDLASLDGISTVKGLQYTNTHGQDYSVARITSQNEAVIDGLQLSQNTKDNMHQAVRAGSTVVTPNKPISKGVFTGTLYIVLDADGTGTYAIGEQRGQNGGFVTNEFGTEFVVVDLPPEEDPRNVGTGTLSIAMTQANNNVTVTYQDWTNGQRVLCAINNADSQQISTALNNDIQNPNLRPWYGKPCAKGTAFFGNQVHTYFLTTNGIKFVDYAYWDTVSNIIYKFDDYIVEHQRLPQTDINHIASETRNIFSFSVPLATFRQSICETNGYINCGEYGTVYYLPYINGNTKGKVFRAHGFVLDKLAEKNNSVIKLLGLPTSDEEYAPTSGEVTGPANDKNRSVQSFQNGKIYTYKLPSGWTQGKRVAVYTYGKLTQVHDQNQGVSGVLGFPASDPKTRDNYVYQLFEGEKEIIWKTNDPQQAYVDDYHKFQCAVFGDIDPISGKWYDGFTNLGIQLLGMMDSGLQMLDAENIEGMTKAITLTTPLISYGPSSVYWLAKQDSNEFNELFNEIKQIKFSDIILVVNQIQSAKINQLKQDWQRSFGSQGCSARQAYIEGRITGEVLLIVLPTSKLKLASKLKLVNSLGKIGETKKLGMFADLADDLSVKLLVQDEKLLMRMLEQENSFFTKFKFKQIYNSEFANTEYFLMYNNPVPFTPNTKVVDLVVKDSSSLTNEFVRFHKNGNSNRPFILRRKDIPYMANGKIDIQKVRQYFNIPETNEITTVSRYIPKAGDIIVEGKINGGNDNLLQYAIREPKIVPLERFEEDDSLIQLLP